jgi:4-amino-4-deoxy-L-arabinose transferase-like glycosyltransferase
LHSSSRTKPSWHNQYPTRRAVFRSVIILVLFTAAFGIRLYNIGKPPLDFSTIRQYQDAHIARGIYYEKNDSVSEQKKRIAKINMERIGLVLEPRIIENAAVLGYRLSGAEHLWIPRVLSVTFWIIGGVFLYLTAKMLFSSGVSTVSTFFYLFLPYSILSSRIFQPDPLMVMMMLWSIYRIVKYDVAPSQLNFVTAALVSAIAVLIKPYCVFIIFGGFFSLIVFREGFWKSVFNRNTFFFGFMICLPYFVYYGHEIFTGTGFLGEHTKGSFLPRLLIYLPFWSGWFDMIGRVVGYAAFFIAILGLLRAGSGRPKALLLGLWGGYFLFGLSAPYQIHTHSYYHMPFIPIVALSIAPVVAMFIDRPTPFLSRRLKAGLFVLVVLAGLGAGLSIRNLPLKSILSDHKNELKMAAAIAGINTEFAKLFNTDYEGRVKTAKEIGEYVGHSTNTLFLTPEFGRVLTYYGEFAGLPWPTSVSLYGRRVRGERVPDIDEDFTPDHVTLLYQGTFVKYTPDFFIITAFDEFDSQVELKRYLYSNFPVLVQNNKYLIFDLRKMSEQGGFS